MTTIVDQCRITARHLVHTRIHHHLRHVTAPRQPSRVIYSHHLTVTSCLKPSHRNTPFCRPPVRLFTRQYSSHACSAGYCTQQFSQPVALAAPAEACLSLHKTLAAQMASDRSAATRASTAGRVTACLLAAAAVPSRPASQRSRRLRLLSTDRSRG